MRIQITGIALSFLAITFSCTNAQKEELEDQGALPNIVLLMGDDHE